jgi:hypothetical protein
MHIPIQFRAIQVLIVALCFTSTFVLGQTYSPYTPEQIKEFNKQPISPEETPMGPVYPGDMPINQAKKQLFDSRYIRNPEGEQEAEAQGAESAVPFEPIPATFTY